jgi:hypothetical protein
LKGESTIYNGISETLQAYYQKAAVKPIAYRLEPLQGNLYSITTEEGPEEEPQPLKQSIYGNYTL